ncbi:MAG: SDR family oxidoreductase, partial [Deltaproteobacteria bacterium]|nr:SDR family oxidoreductase [Deltaproteobacteria bacterium]
ACCAALAREGFQVAVHCNSSRTAAHEVAQDSPGAFVMQADLATIAGADFIYEEIKKRGGNLGVLVNNAAIVNDSPLFSATLESFEITMNTNLRGVWYLTKRLARFMMRKKEGRIVNISSVIAHTGNATQSIYGMSKAAIDNFTKTAAIELAEYGILVNSIAPGFIDTAMTKSLSQELKSQILARVPLKRMGEASEVAELVAFLATRGSYCTGAVFHINGGMYGG